MKNDRPPRIFMIPFIAIGIGCMFFPIKNIVNRALVSKNYEKTTGYFDKTSYCSDDDEGHESCTLEYTFKVNNQKYRITSEDSTSMAPAKGSTKTIKYNPENPQEALIVGDVANIWLILLGFMFTFIPACFLIDFEKMGDKFHNIFIGFMFAGMGGGVYYFIGSAMNSFSLIAVFRALGIFILVPILFMIVGVLAMITPFLPNWKKESDSYYQSELEIEAERRAKEENKQKL